MRKYFRKKQKQRSVTLKTAEEIAIMREAGRLVAQTFEHIKPLVKPGARLVDIDRAASDYLTSKGAKPLYKGYRGSPPTQPPFPGVICASIGIGFDAHESFDLVAQRGDDRLGRLASHARHALQRRGVAINDGGSDL